MDDDFTVDLRLLSKAQATALLSPRRISLGYRVRQGREWIAQPFEFEVDARPLAVLIESAARGHRLYELLRIERPGDVLHHLAVRVTDGGQSWMDRFSHIQDESRRREAAWRRHSWPRFDQQQGWSPWRPWNIEGEGLMSPWFHWRNSPAALPDLGGLLALVRLAAARLRHEAGGLIAHELTLFDSGTHWRDRWAQPDPVDVDATVPPPLPPERAELVAALIDLARRPDIGSLSCGFSEPTLWQGLIEEQLRRRAAGAAPLHLGGPDSGLPHVIAQDFGADLLIPGEGQADADLFVVPDWFEFDAESAKAAGTVAAGAHDRAYRMLLSEHDLGSYPRDRCRRCAGWYLYEFDIKTPPWALVWTR